MTATAAPVHRPPTRAAVPRHVRPRRPRLSRGVAFHLLSSIVITFLSASSAPTPLYAIYQREWGYSPITTTVVFGIYALAVLVALLVVGSLSDHVGRRPVLIAATVVEAVSMLVFTTADGVPALMIARVVQGLAVGASVGAIGGGMLDIDRARGTTANAIMPLVGTATGGMVAGLLVTYLPWPVHLVYWVLFGIFVLQGAGALLMPETSDRVPGALASLRPRFGVPAAARRPFLVAVPVLVAVWALGGFYGSVGPVLARHLAGSGSILLGAVPLSVLAVAGGIMVTLLRRARPDVMMLVGVLALLAGVGLTVIAIETTTPAVFFVGTAIAGAGFGGGFQGAIRSVVPLAAPHERAGLLSSLWVVSYLGMGLPAVAAGFMVVRTGSVITTGAEYGVAVMALAALALPGMLRGRRRAPAVAVRPCSAS
jgi:predicted MFS family arabinose efflux permease